MSGRTTDKRVAILATDGFEQAELVQPKQALEQAGAEVHVVSIEPGDIQGFKHFDKGDTVAVDRVLGDVEPADYDALVIPGGLFNPDAMRQQDKALNLVRAVIDAGKPVAAICHGPWVLVNAERVKGRTLTSVASIRKDLENAGATWVDEQVHVDRNLISSRTPKDLDAFCKALIDMLASEQAQRSAA